MVVWPPNLSIQKVVCQKKGEKKSFFSHTRNTNRNTFHQFGLVGGADKQTNEQTRKGTVIVLAVLSGGRLHGLGSCGQPILLGSKTLGACRCPKSLAARLITASGRGQMCQSLLGLAAFSPPGS